MNTPTLNLDADFHLARIKAFLHRIVAVVLRQPRALLSYDEVRERLHLGGPIYRGLQTVQLDRIVGSVDRYRDFDRLFLPTQSHTEQRWNRINRAWYSEVSLPPVLLYKVGEAYFVIDGNHRVSVARARGQDYIEAEVRECTSRVPVTADVGPDDLERLGEKVDFLERTRIDQLRPGAVLEPTVLGGFDRLLEHIAVHRYFMGIDQKRAIPEAEAVVHWHDTLFAPVGQAIGQSGILEAFPGRTATDLYLWVMDHLHYLRERPGAEDVDPAEATRNFLQDLTMGIESIDE
jgi:hypothetical protein